MSLSKTALVFLLLTALVLMGTARPASAQVTSASVVGSIHDSSGSVVPGATVALISKAHGTTLVAMSSDGGDFVFPTVGEDTYTLRITMDGFKMLKREDVVVHSGDTVAIGVLILESEPQ
jgi:hypothetical protein